MTGVMGSGKSTVARSAAARLGAIVIRTDAVRKRLAGLPLHERALEGFGQGLYTVEMGRRTYAEALRLAEEALVAGWPVVLDGSFSHAAERGAARALAARLGFPFAVLWCDAPDAEIEARLSRRVGDRFEVSDGRPELLPTHRARYESPAEEPGVTRIDTTGDAEHAVERALRVLAHDSARP
jgi:hypothetical protein